MAGESKAGAGLDRALAPGEAARIFTGAPVPEGADTILVQEEAARDGVRVRLDGEGPPTCGYHVRARGSDFGLGDRLIAAGERLTAPRIALAAMGGHGTLPVPRRARVTILSTGDELVAPGAPVSGVALPASNGPMLAAMLASLPVDVVDGGILPDRLDRLTAAFAAAAPACDVIVTTGGASVGDHDLVRPALIAAGADLDFWRVRMRPGKPLMAGALGETIIVGLPGNPVSAFVTATLFLRPLIAHLGGAGDPLPRPQRAILGAALPANDRRQDYLRARLARGADGALDATPFERQDSSMMSLLAHADCLVVRAPLAAEAAPGSLVEIIPFATGTAAI
jgi:molybdopterin molybdotransferase